METAGSKRWRSQYEIDAAYHTTKTKLIVLSRACTLTSSEPVVFVMDLSTALLYGALLRWPESVFSGLWRKIWIRCKSTRAHSSRHYHYRHHYGACLLGKSKVWHRCHICQTIFQALDRSSNDVFWVHFAFNLSFLVRVVSTKKKRSLDYFHESR